LVALNLAAADVLDQMFGAQRKRADPKAGSLSYRIAATEVAASRLTGPNPDRR
jgi:hypothetical protein